jgi:hypothetical protein
MQSGDFVITLAHCHWLHACQAQSVSCTLPKLNQWVGPFPEGAGGLVGVAVGGFVGGLVGGVVGGFLGVGGDKKHKKRIKECQ